MIKRRFSQRALAYGLSAVLALSAVLLSLYLPDTLARLGDGGLAPLSFAVFKGD